MLLKKRLCVKTWLWLLSLEKGNRANFRIHSSAEGFSALKRIGHAWIWRLKRTVPEASSISCSVFLLRVQVICPGRWRMVSNTAGGSQSQGLGC